MACITCATIRKHYANDPQAYRMHDEGCLHCGARLIQKMQRLYQLTAQQRSDRSRDALAAWMCQGHDEQQLRKLAKGAWAVQPKGGKCAA